VTAAARRIKTAGEITCLDVASAIAESALSAMEAALQPGITERELLGIYHEQVATLGAPNPPSESVCFATPFHGPVRFRHLASDRPVGDGELVVLAPGACMPDTSRVGPHQGGRASAPPGRRIWHRGVLGNRCAAGVCRPGNTGADLYRAWEDAGNPASPVPLAHGSGSVLSRQ